MKKGREKGGKEEKKKRVIKHTLKYLYEAEILQKNPQKQGRILKGGGDIFLAGQNIYPCCNFDDYSSFVNYGVPCRVIQIPTFPATPTAWAISSDLSHPITIIFYFLSQQKFRYIIYLSNRQSFKYNIKSDTLQVWRYAQQLKICK